MTPKYKVPGVYREDVFLNAQPRLPTGVPGFVGFADADADAFNKPIAFNRKGEFDARFKGLQGSYLADAVTGFFQNGGVTCFVVLADLGDDRQAAMKNDATTSFKREGALKKALESLAPVTDLDLVAMPDAMTLKTSDTVWDVAGIIRLQKEVLQHCEKHRGRLAILDAVPGAGVDTVKDQRIQIAANLKEPLNGALYFPWLKVDGLRLVPPSGHVAGIFARSDARVGVFKAPANEEISGALDLEVVVDNAIQDQLNPEGINCLRAFPGRGIRVWGARTISREPDWQYVNVRRLFLTLERWIDLNMNWASFEPNTARLWVRIKRELSAYLEVLWRAGGLAGGTADQAYFVKCDAETNPPEVRDTGEVVTEVGLAPSRPAEFVVVRITHHIGVDPR
jgi:phage tail sheath protein FI